MRISDWSSDVCSSDLCMTNFLAVLLICTTALPTRDCTRETATDVMTVAAATPFECLMRGQTIPAGTAFADSLGRDTYPKVVRSEERRVGKECVSTCRSRWAPST